MKKILLFIAVSLLSIAASNAQALIDKCTYRFVAEDERELYLDIYKTTDEVQPCVIYAFGGGFFTGARDDAYAVKYYKFLVSQGFKVVAIDYRLGLRPLVENKDSKVGLKEFRSMLIGAVGMAADDLLCATTYVVENADRLGIDPTKIVACGSSAGAITAYQAEYEICNRTEAARVLPEGFNYAGVIGFAGAVLAESGKFGYKSAPCPMMLFHGNADSNVPYDKMSLMGYSFYGSNRIVKELDKADAAYWFYDANYVNHSLAGTPQSLNRDEIAIFLKRVVLDGKRLQVHQRVNDLALPKVKTKFKIGDYIDANFYRPDQSVSDEIVEANKKHK